MLRKADNIQCVSLFIKVIFQLNELNLETNKWSLCIHHHQNYHYHYYYHYYYYHYYHHHYYHYYYFIIIYY